MTWLQVAQATGAKFDDYVAETSPAGMLTDLGYVNQLASEGILASIEGGDEEDDAYPKSLGNTLPITANFQQQVYALGQQLGLPVINMSFGAGWTAANNWQGDYGTIGDLSAYTTYGNAHTYPNVGQLPDAEIQYINGLAKMAASTRPVITTEIGWQTSDFAQQTIAKYVLDAAMDGLKDGDAGMYFYGMYDDGSGNWGLFNSNGTPRPAATAMHDLTALLADGGANAATFVPGSLSYSLSGTQAGDNAVLIEKSNGSFWLSLWNETEASGSPHTVTVNLRGQATTVAEYDPLTGTGSVKTWSNVSSFQVSVPDHPVLLEIIPSATSTGGGGGGGGGTSGGGGSGTPTGPAITVPASESVIAGTTTTISGVSITDSFAASNPGTMVLNLSDSSGQLTITDASGNKASGSGTSAITFIGTFAQLTTELAHLSYTAGKSAGTDGITVNVWDQAGLEQTKTISVTIAAAPSGPVITLPATLGVTPASTTPISGISVTDAYSASHPGNMVLDLNAGSSTLTMVNNNGTKVTGSGTHAISFIGTFAQLTYDLAHLTYTSGATTASDSVSAKLWDQAGLETTGLLAVSVASTTVTNIAPKTAAPVISVSHATIGATQGDHMIFIGGSNEVLTTTGGIETVQGSNTVTTRDRNDAVQIDGSGNIVNAGSANRRDGWQVMDDIHSYVIQNGHALDLRGMLAGTQWNQSSTSLGNYLRGNSEGATSMTPGGVTGKASYNVATLHCSGAVTLANLSTHSTT